MSILIIQLGLKSGFPRTGSDSQNVLGKGFVKSLKFTALGCLKQTAKYELSRN